MTSRKTDPSLDKNFIFLNTKGLCLLCYEECPMQILERRRVTTQTSINFTKLMSRYLGFSVDNVIASPLRKVGRKCAKDRDQQNDNKKFDKIGFELCDRCEAVAQAFCEVQAKIELHQMILNKHVRSISEIIKDGNKKTAAELFRLSEDDDAIRKQQKTFTRLSLGGLRSANMLRNNLYKRSIHKLSKSFPIIKLKRICKSGDWIQLLSKDDNNDLVKALPANSKDLLLASLLGCVVSLWIVLSLSFIQADEFVLKIKEDRLKSKESIPMPIVNCDDLEIELNFPSKKKSTQEPQVKSQRRSKRTPKTVPSKSSSIAQKDNPPLPPPPPRPAKFQPVVIHKYPNQIVQISKNAGSQHQTPSSGSLPDKGSERTGSGPIQTNPAASWKPKSVQYSASIPSVQMRAPSPARNPVIRPHSPSHQVSRPIPQYPSMPPPRPYSIPPPTTVLSSPSSNYDPAYAYPSTSSVSHALPPPPPSSSTSHQPQYYSNTNNNQNVNGNMSSSYNYNYNFSTYNYNSPSTWTPPPYEAAPVDHPPQAAYSAVNGGYDPYNTQVNGSMENGYNSSTGYDYGYDYNNYPPPNHPNNYQYQNTPSNQYHPQSSSHSEGNMYSAGPDPSTVGGGYDSNCPSYATLLPRAPISVPSYDTVAAPAPPSSAPMEMDMTNTSTSDEPSLTHEDPQSLDSEENSSMSADDHMEDESDAGGGGQQSPQLIFPECHWRQQNGSDPPISCQKPGCTEQFITHEQIRLHLLAHGEFQCNFCHLVFTKAHNLAHHEKTRHCKNTTVGKGKCPRCSFTSTSQYKYFLHFLTYHLRISLYDKPCQICNKPFILGTKNINRKNHFRVYHDVEGKDPSTIFSCKGCDAQFLKEAQLRDHQPNCTSIASVSSVVSSVASSVEEITYNTALATADQIVVQNQ